MKDFVVPRTDTKILGKVELEYAFQLLRALRRTPRIPDAKGRIPGTRTSRVEKCVVTG